MPGVAAFGTTIGKAQPNTVGKGAQHGASHVPEAAVALKGASRAHAGALQAVW